MNTQRIVATAPIGEPAISILDRVAKLETAPAPDEQTMMTMLDGTIAIVCRGEGGASRKLIEAADALKVIGRCGAGYDSVDVAAATERGIPLVIAPVGGFAVAEGALAMLLSLVKLLPMADHAVKRGDWKWRYDHLSGDMAEKTLGLIGVGRIGSHLAKLVQPFTMTVLAYDPYANVSGIEQVELDELLVRSDYISLHTPLNDETRDLINAECIAKMKRGAILINTSRGGVIESLDVLADALDSGRLAAVGLDVFPTEPPDTSHRIFKNPRCLCSPHLVGGSELAMSRIYESMANDMVAVIAGRRPRFCVNPEIFSKR